MTKSKRAQISQMHHDYIHFAFPMSRLRDVGVIPAVSHDYDPAGDPLATAETVCYIHPDQDTLRGRFTLQYRKNANEAYNPMHLFKDNPIIRGETIFGVPKPFFADIINHPKFINERGMNIGRAEVEVLINEHRRNSPGYFCPKVTSYLDTSHFCTPGTTWDHMQMWYETQEQAINNASERLTPSEVKSWLKDNVEQISDELSFSLIRVFDPTTHELVDECVSIATLHNKFPEIGKYIAEVKTISGQLKSLQTDYDYKRKLLLDLAARLAG